MSSEKLEGASVLPTWSRACRYLLTQKPTRSPRIATYFHALDSHTVRPMVRSHRLYLGSPNAPVLFCAVVAVHVHSSSKASRHLSGHHSYPPDRVSLRAELSLARSHPRSPLTLQSQSSHFGKNRREHRGVHLLTCLLEWGLYSLEVNLIFDRNDWRAQ